MTNKKPDYNKLNIEYVTKIQNAADSVEENAYLQQLYNLNEKIIITRLKHFGITSKDYDELKTSTALQILYKCAKKFNLEANTNFSTYFVNSYDHELLKYINSDGLLSPYMKRQIKIVTDFRENYLKKYKEEPSYKAISDGTGLKISIIKKYVRYSNMHVNVDDESADFSLDTYSIEDSLYSKDLEKALRDAINKLEPNEKTIIEGYYGIGQDPKTLRQLSLIYNISEEGIRQRINRIQEKISKMMEI